VLECCSCGCVLSKHTMWSVIWIAYVTCVGQCHKAVVLSQVLKRLNGVWVYVNNCVI
jgi:hypothetical protein